MIMEEHLKTEIGHWLDKLDDKYCQLVNSYSNGDIRETAEHFYNLAITEFFTPEMMWKIFQVGKEAVEELNGKETATEYVGKLILKKLKI